MMVRLLICYRFMLKVPPFLLPLGSPCRVEIWDHGRRVVSYGYVLWLRPDLPHRVQWVESSHWFTQSRQLFAHVVVDEFGPEAGDLLIVLRDKGNATFFVGWGRLVKHIFTTSIDLRKNCVNIRQSQWILYWSDLPGRRVKLPRVFNFWICLFTTEAS
jgi:hypothetical protein